MKFTAAHFCGNTGFLAFFFEAFERAIDGFAFFDEHFRHVRTVTPVSSQVGMGLRFENRGKGAISLNGQRQVKGEMEQNAVVSEQDVLRRLG